jgi:hypothetical protein
VKKQSSFSRLRAFGERVLVYMCVSAEASAAARVNFGLAPGMNSSSHDTRKQVRGQPATAFMRALEHGLIIGLLDDMFIAYKTKNR